jgi:hypothetical protein
VEDGISRNKDVIDLHSFRGRHSLKPRHNDWMKTKGLVDACLEVFELGHRKVVRLFIAGHVFIYLSLELLEDFRMKGKLMQENGCSCRRGITVYS